VLTYILHRALLHSQSRNRFTEAHLNWQHAFSRPTAILAAYDHPTNYLLARWTPVFLPAVIWRMHLLTWYLWLAIVSIEEVVGYCGYRTAVVLPFVGGCAGRVDRHFEVVRKEGGRAVFSAWGALDWVCGTGEKVEVEETTSEEEEE
jgi:hypothetical protein